MATYIYENSDDERFQQLVQALLLPEFPRLQCLPVGQRDGGRDGVVHDDEDLRDSTILQVKFKRNDTPSENTADWMIKALEGERKAIERIVAGGANRYIVATNARGTAYPDAGGIDRVRDWFAANLSVPALCLWRDDIDRRLEGNLAVQWRYPEVLSGPDAIHLALAASISEDRERRATAVRKFIAHQFERDAEVRFKQVDLRNDLLSLFIDVPATLSSHHLAGSQDAHLVMEVMAGVYERLPTSRWMDEEQARFSGYQSGIGWPFSIGTADLLLDAQFSERAPRVVLEGAPGQGKSTLGQYVCQVHRARLLGKIDVIARLPKSHQSSPVRLPMKVDLRDLATWMGGRDPFLPENPAVAPEWTPSLEAFLARQVRAHSGGIPFDAYDLSASTEGVPLLLFLDGLDEVAGVEERSAVVDAVRAGLTRLSATGAQVQVVVTTRPAAFAKSPGFPRREFVGLQLVDLPRSLVREYADRWIAARRLDENDSVEVRRILSSKLNLPHIRDLARNPMQLAILLGLIYAVGYSLPDERTDLYTSYMDRFLTREAEKSPAVQRHRGLLVRIHQHLAWVLQSRAESRTGASGSVTSEELRKLIAQFLVDRGHPTDIVDELFTGVLERVYVLVQRIEGSYEFEVQPLREYFCATYLYETAPVESVGEGEPKGSRRERFEAMSRNPYWTNVLRFYAGCYRSGELGGLYMQLEDLRDQGTMGRTFRPRYVGATLLADWVFRESPRITRHVAELVFDELGLKGAASGFGQGTEEALSLPLGCGRDELGGAAIDVVERRGGLESRGDMIRVARANMTSALGDRVVELARGATGGARSCWFKVAAEAGVLNYLEERTLIELLTGDNPEEAELSDRCVVLGHHAPDAASGIAVVRSRVVAVALRGRLFGGISPDSWLDALGVLVSPTMLDFEMRHAGNARRWLSGDLKRLEANVPEDLPEVRRLLSEAGSDAPTLGAGGRITVEAAEREIERVVEILGEVWGARASAVVAAAIPGRTRRGDEVASSMFDSSAPLLSRARRARYWSGSSSWWADQLDFAQVVADRMFWAALLIVWGRRGAVEDNLELLEGVISQVSVEEYEDLYLAVSLGSRHRSRRLRTSDHIEVTDLFSDRLGALLDARLARWVRDGVLRSKLGAGADPVVRRTRDRAELYELLQSMTEENCEGRLRRIKGLYGTLGADRITTDGNLVLTHQSAQTVLADPLSYPYQIVAAAERRVSHGVRIQPVAKVAERSRWSFE